MREKADTGNRRERRGAEQGPGSNWKGPAPEPTVEAAPGRVGAPTPQRPGQRNGRRLQGKASWKDWGQRVNPAFPL